MNDEHIRELCSRVIRAEGEEFQAAMMELLNAISLRESTQDKDAHSSAASL